MADEPLDPVEIEDEPEIEDDLPPEDEPSEESEPEESEEAPVYTFGDEGEDEDRPEDSRVIKTLRDQLREEKRRRHELEKSAPKPVDEVGPKPTLESCDWDEERFERDLTAYTLAKGRQEAQQNEARQAQEKQQQAWQAEVATFYGKVQELRIPDFKDAEQTVSDAFGTGPNADAAKMAFVKAKDPALVAALARSPAKLADLVALKDDPFALAIAIGELKGKTVKRNVPKPDVPRRGQAPTGSADKELARLEKEADRTGDRSALIAYKTKQRNAA